MKLKWMRFLHRNGQGFYEVLVDGEIVATSPNWGTALAILNTIPYALEVDSHLVEFMQGWLVDIPVDRQSQFAKDVADLWQQGFRFAQESVYDWHEPRE